jgi:hypothetical protein
MLLGEAEALQLVEVGTGLGGRHIVCGGTGHRRLGEIDGAVDHHLFLAGMDGDRRLERPELPAEIGGFGRVEANGDEPVGHLLIGRRARALRRAAIARHLAEEAVERHRGGGEADHRGDDREQRAHRGAIAAIARGHQKTPILTSVIT